MVGRTNPLLRFGRGADNSESEASSVPSWWHKRHLGARHEAILSNCQSGTASLVMDGRELSQSIGEVSKHLDPSPRPLQNPRHQITQPSRTANPPEQPISTGPALDPGRPALSHGA